jgi:hypothetical protein
LWFDATRADGFSRDPEQDLHGASREVFGLVGATWPDIRPDEFGCTGSSIVTTLTSKTVYVDVAC